MVQEFIVYVIFDLARPESVRYVGLTSRSIKQRMYEHWKTVRNSGIKRPLYLWMRKRLPEQVGIRVIEQCDSLDTMRTAEIKWIAHYRSLGQADLNVTDGGEGVWGYRATPELLAWYSATRTGKPGHPISPEHRKAVGDAARKRLETPEARQEHAIRVATLTPEEVTLIKERLWSGDAQTHISKDMGISFQNVSNISRGVSWDFIPWPIGPARKPYTQKGKRGEQAAASKLTDEQVLHIRATTALGEYPKVAREMGVSVATVSNIMNRKVWKHLL